MTQEQQITRKYDSKPRYLRITKSTGWVQYPVHGNKYDVWSANSRVIAVAAPNELIVVKSQSNCLYTQSNYLVDSGVALVSIVGSDYFQFEIWPLFASFECDIQSIAKEIPMTSTSNKFTSNDIMLKNGYRIRNTSISMGSASILRKYFAGCAVATAIWD